MKEHFEMRQLTKGDIEEFDELLAYAFQVTTKVLNDSGWSKDEMRRSKKPIFDMSYVIGWFYKGMLASQIVTYPMKMNIHGTIYEIGGITGVATYPEYTGQGLAHTLMRECIRYMKNTDKTIGILCPYSFPFYREMGWEIVSDKMKFIINDNQLPKKVAVPGMTERVDIEDEDIRTIYARYALRHHGALIRGDLEWEEYWRWDSDDINAAVYYNGKEEPVGYVIYDLENEVFKVKEMIYLTQEGRHGIWNYISAHYSMVSIVEGCNYSGETIAFELPDSEITETITPNIMARIIDVEGFLSNYPFQVLAKDFIIYLKIEDNMAEWNDGVFCLRSVGEEIFCEKVDEWDDELTIKMSICTLTTMFMSYKRPAYLYKNERIEGSGKVIVQLEKIIPNEKPHFSDYF